MTKFNSNNLSVLAYANGFTQWHYKADSITDIDSLFFANASDLIVENDRVSISSKDGIAEAVFRLQQEKIICYWLIFVEFAKPIKIAPQADASLLKLR
jgi:hypothetical protein